MKKLLLILLLFTTVAQAQTVPPDSTLISGATNVTLQAIYKGANASTSVQGWRNPLNGKYYYFYSTYQSDQRYARTDSTIVSGGAISSTPEVGFNPGTNISAATWIERVYYQTQVPTASLSGGTTYELGITAATHNLSFSYGRQAATATISTAVIEPGPLDVYSTQPAQGASVSGTQSVTTPSNTNRTYTLTVTTSDSKTATATTTDTWLPGRYWGRSAIDEPDNTIILAVAGGAKQLNGTKANTGFTVTSSGSNYVYYAYPASLGDLTSILVGGFESIGAFTKRVVSVTNVNGYTQNYNVYTSNSTFSATTPTIITN